MTPSLATRALFSTFCCLILLQGLVSPTEIKAVFAGGLCALERPQLSSRLSVAGHCLHPGCEDT